MQFFLVIGIPILGMFLIFGTGLLNLNSLNNEISDLNTLHAHYETMIHGDRDGYQAFLAHTKSSPQPWPRRNWKRTESPLPRLPSMLLTACATILINWAY